MDFTERAAGKTVRSTAVTELGVIAVEADARGTVTRLTLDALPSPDDSPTLIPLIHDIVAALSDSDKRLNINVAPHVSEFQAVVLKALTEIPQGALATYTAIARMAGRPRAVRAVASAIGRNPLPLLIPCHRVVPMECAYRGVTPATIGNYTPRKELKAAILEREGYFSGDEILFLK